MRKRKNIRYSEDILEYLKGFKKFCTNKKVFLYGAGKYAEELFRFIDLEQFSISGYIDDDYAKKGKKFKNFDIYHVEDLPALDPDIIIITTKQLFDIKDKLHTVKKKYNLNFIIYVDFFDKFEKFIADKEFRYADEYDLNKFFFGKDLCFIDNAEIKKLNFIGKDSFNENTSIKKSKELFSKSIKIVEIEPFSFCNRKCWFCPNSYIDRQSENHIMPEEIFLKVVKELKEIDYSKCLTFTRYNEPLSNTLIFDRIKKVREMLPNVFININSNGDYLNNKTVENLYQAGLDRIEIQIYPEKNQENFDESHTINKINNVIKLLGLENYNITTKIIPGVQVIVDIFYKNSLIVSFSGKDMNKVMFSRGGYLNEYFKGKKERIEPCFSSFVNFIIDYNGNVMPCCNLRSDIEAHKDYILGNIYNNSIFEIFMSKENLKLKMNLLKYGKKPTECINCYYLIYLEDTVENRHKIEKIRKHFEKV